MFASNRRLPATPSNSRGFQMSAARLLVCAASMVPIFAVAALSIVPRHAAADVAPVAPRYVVVSADGAAMKCHDGSFYYDVRPLKKGEVLRVDGESKGWLRVEYLPGTPAYVPAAEGELTADGKTLKLKRATSLLAVNANGQPPWWNLLEANIPAGTTFSGVEVVKSADNTIVGFHVPAPAKARGYVARAAVEDATDAQARTYTGATPPPAPAVAPAVTTAATTPPVTPAVTTPSTTASTATPTTPVQPPVVQNPAKPGETTTTTVEMSNPPGTTTTKTTSTQTEPVPAGFEAVDGTGRTTSTRTITQTSTPVPVGSTPPAAPAVPLTRRIDDINTLRSVYERGMTGDTAELGTTISEFQRSLGALTNADPRLVAELQKRLEALRLRQDIVNAKNASMTLTATIEERTRRMGLALAEVSKQAVYTIVGTMVPSTVYDGTRGLPLMYRIESPDTYSTRTVGYVVPRKGLDFITKTGRLVGIIGDSKIDPALAVTIVSPSRIDVLNYVEGKIIIESTESLQSSTSTTVEIHEPAPAPTDTSTSANPAVPPDAD